MGCGTGKGKGERGGWLKNGIGKRRRDCIGIGGMEDWHRNWWNGISAAVQDPMGGKVKETRDEHAGTAAI